MACGCRAAIGKLGNQTAATTYGNLAAAVEKDIKAAGANWCKICTQAIYPQSTSN